MGKPSVFPTGVTIFNKEKTYSGYTLFTSSLGTTLIDMNGRLVKVWKGLGVSPVKPLPDGQILASSGRLPGNPGAGSNIHVIQVDWDGNIVWDYCHNKKIKLENGNIIYASCHHHDFEKLGLNADCFFDGIKQQPNSGNTIILTHNKIRNIKISDKPLLDERIIEVNAKGETIWEWNANEHIDEFGLDGCARQSLYANPTSCGDWIHINSVSSLGNNRFYKSGDKRFAPENLICSARQLNIVFIIEKTSGKIVWRIGPDYLRSSAKTLGQIIGQHNAHMIPENLSGAGNILLLDNGSFGGFGLPSGVAPEGIDVVRRHYSRALEFDPSTLEIKWEYKKAIPFGKNLNEMNAQQFFSPYIGSVQRLPNGNTLITEGADGILIEVTPENEIVWEFVNPILSPNKPKLMRASVYRSYRLPYKWATRLQKPEEISIVPPENIKFRVPGSFGLGNVADVETNVNIPQ